VGSYLNNIVLGSINKTKQEENMLQVLAFATVRGYPAWVRFKTGTETPVQEMITQAT
jgi:hypothetical protein